MKVQNRSGITFDAQKVVRVPNRSKYGMLSRIPTLKTPWIPIHGHGGLFPLLEEYYSLVRTATSLESIDLNVLVKLGGGVLAVVCHHPSASYNLEVDDLGNILLFIAPASHQNFLSNIRAKPFSEDGVLRLNARIAVPYFTRAMHGHTKKDTDWDHENWGDVIREIRLLCFFEEGAIY